MPRQFVVNSHDDQCDNCAPSVKIKIILVLQNLHQGKQIWTNAVSYLRILKDLDNYIANVSVYTHTKYLEKKETKTVLLACVLFFGGVKVLSLFLLY